MRFESADLQAISDDDFAVLTHHHIERRRRIMGSLVQFPKDPEKVEKQEKPHQTDASVVTSGSESNLLHLEKYRAVGVILAYLRGVMSGRLH